MRNCKLCRPFRVAITILCWMFFFSLFFFFPPLSLQTVGKGKRQVVMQALHAVETAELIGQRVSELIRRGVSRLSLSGRVQLVIVIVWLFLSSVFGYIFVLWIGCLGAFCFIVRLVGRVLGLRVQG